MLKIIFFIFSFAQNSHIDSVPPDEKEIYFHLHQVTHWAELIYLKNCTFSKPEMEKHLKSIKYTQTKLVNSKFYKDYVFLEKLAFNRTSSSQVELEKFRNQLHLKAEKLKITHPENWQNEFVLCK